MDKVDIAEHMRVHQLDDSEIAIGMEMLKFIESKKEVGASSIELLVRNLVFGVDLHSNVCSVSTVGEIWIEIFGQKMFGHFQQSKHGDASRSGRLHVRPLDLHIGLVDHHVPFQTIKSREH